MQAIIDLSERAEPVLMIAPDIYLRPLAAREVTARYINGINDPQINRLRVSAQNGPCGNIRAHDVTKHRACIGIAIFDSKMHGKGIGCAAISALGRSEMRDFPHPRSLEGARALGRIRGACVGLEAAEASAVIRQIERQGSLITKFGSS
jgi:hypothetical protein